jgi:hypothetical protein
MEGMVAAELDYSTESLARIDRALAQGRIRADGEGVFESVVAYTGEVIRVAGAGSWRAERSEDGTTFDPVVLVGGRKVYPALIIYKQLELPAGDRSIRGAVMGQLAALRTLRVRR